MTWRLRDRADHNAAAVNANADMIVAVRRERDAAVARADTAERRLAEIRDLCDEHWINPLTRDLGWDDAEPDERTLVVLVDDVRQVLAAPGPVPVTPVTEDQQ